MQGASRIAFTDASQALFRRLDDSGDDGNVDVRALGDELLAVAALLGEHLDLRRSLVDAGSPVAGRTSMLRGLLDGRVSAATLDVVVDTVSLRWSGGPDLVDAVERLGALALYAAAEDEGRLDAVEDELYRLSRIVSGDDRLRSALSASWLPLENKRALVGDLLVGRVDRTTLALVEHVVRSARGRPVGRALEDLAELAGTRRGRIYAQAFSAVVLDAAQLDRLEAAVSRIYGRSAKVSVVLDPSVIGGVRLVVGGEVIDGSVAHRLDQARAEIIG